MSAERTSLGISGRIAAAFQASRMTPLLALVALLLGMFATLVTPREEEPQIDVTMADVLVAFPGASAKDVETWWRGPASRCCRACRRRARLFGVAPRHGGDHRAVRRRRQIQRRVLRLYDTVHSHRDWLSPNLGVMEPVIKPRGIDDVPIVGLTFWTATRPVRPSTCSRWRGPSRSNSSASRAPATYRRSAARTTPSAC
jgi:hypothetical protein